MVRGQGPTPLKAARETSPQQQLATPLPIVEPLPLQQAGVRGVVKVLEVLVGTIILQSLTPHGVSPLVLPPRPLAEGGGGGLQAHQVPRGSLKKSHPHILRKIPRPLASPRRYLLIS